jgi:NAD(P)-dependent dehydrogenase (short-subunit alcohol dehydrogenase family)
MFSHALEDHCGRKVLILGASYGIGRATADLLADQGAHVVYASRSKDLLDAAVERRDHCHAVVIDASDTKSIEEGINRAVSLLGGLDCVVYLPGYFGSNSYGTFERLFDSGDFECGFENSLQMHLKGMMVTFQHSRKHLLKSRKGGCFIALSSVAGSMGHPGAALYAIAKAAVDAAVRQLALEYAPQGLRVLSVAPGLINTPAIDNLGPDRAGFMKNVGDSHAMQRYGEPSEVAEVIAFLCSERASFMTGGPVFVDGGTMLRSALGDAIRPFTTGPQSAESSSAQK